MKTKLDYYLFRFNVGTQFFCYLLLFKVKNYNMHSLHISQNACNIRELYISNIYIFEIYQNIIIIGGHLECSRYRHARTNSVNTKCYTISWGEEFFYEWPKVISKVYDYKQSFFNYIYLEYITIVKRLIHLIAISLFNHHLI